MIDRNSLTPLSPDQEEAAIQSGRFGETLAMVWFEQLIQLAGEQEPGQELAIGASACARLFALLLACADDVTVNAEHQDNLLVEDDDRYQLHIDAIKMHVAMIREMKRKDKETHGTQTN